ncbi:MAG: ABC transporter permease [Bacteroidetes bacterium]|nr:ABC transporter permease [Bacteroidota bacterium]MBU1116137.1 ABC transporter permease [Bacteroidota bacterium]MBU1800429.1 ABC transporter permease [Bacteroidota bacterium]
MDFLEILKVALTSLKANKLRSSLTILGIVVGIFSIIAISTIIAMLQTSIEEGVSSLGSNTFQVQKWPAVRMGGHAEMAKYRNRKDITIDNFDNLDIKLVEAKAIAATSSRGGRVIKYENEKTNPNVRIYGVTPNSFITRDWNVETGRAINTQDYKNGRKVVVLGTDLLKTLFKNKNINPIGEEISVNGNRLKIIGILEDQGAIFGQSQGNLAIIPLTTFNSFYGNRRSLSISVMAKDKLEYSNLMEITEGYLRTIRKVFPGDDNDFEIVSNESVMKQINDITAGVRIGAFVIAGIALLAAGVGIMNIMLVSVTERTKEIGLRKAVGAKNKNILMQFLAEAVTLSLIGGFVGIVLGILVGNFVGSQLNAVATIPFDWVAIGVLLCVLIGVGFGTYPAYKASNLDPIEALRWE